MRNRSFLPILLICCVPHVALAQSSLDIGALRSGLERSPDDYVAGVFKHVGAIRCDTPSAGTRRCWSKVVVVDEIASRPASKAPRVELKVAVQGEPGRQFHGSFIAFLIPFDGTEVYAGTYRDAYGEKAYRRFRDLVETTITGKRSL